MRTLLVAVNSQYIHSNPALFALRRSAEQAGCAKMLSSAEFSINMPPAEICAAILEKRPDILAFSVYIWNVSFLTPLLADLRRLLPDTLFLLGGPEASARARHYLLSLPIDGVCIGEGEEAFASFLNIVATLDGNANALAVAALAAKEIPGWMWRGHEDAYLPAPLPDLARLPFLYTEEEGRALKAAHKVVYYESSRGCPHACAFCASAKEPLRERPLDLVLEELPLLADMGGQIKFIDRTFNADIERALRITEKVLSLYRPGLSWHFEISPFYLPDALIDLWLTSPADYFKLEMGVQTLNREALRAVGRHGDWAEVEPKVERLIAGGVNHLHLDLIAGLPKDTPEGFAASFHRLHQLNADYLQFGFLKLLPSSLLAEKAASYGLVASDWPPYRVLSTPTMSADYLFSLLNAERAFNALYNKGDFRPQLLQKAETYPGGALEMYHRASSWMSPGGMNRKDKAALVAAL